MESRPIELVIPEGVRPSRVDKALADAFEQYSRSDFQRALEADLVEVNGRPVPKNFRVAAGDVVAFTMPEKEGLAMEPIDLGLPIVYEDEYLVAVDKPAGLVTHPGAGRPEPTLVHGLLHVCGGNLSGAGGEDRPGIVHRLDRDTSGMIVAAKTDEAHSALADMFRNRSLIKEYLALASGGPELLSGVIRKPIERHPEKRHKMRICKAGRGRESRTDWTLEKRYSGGYSLLRCRIHTGRTHQIRVHLQSIGHPILGDPTYGYRQMQSLPVEPERVMLHSARLAFTHPFSGEKLDLAAPLPADFAPFIDRGRELG